MKSFFVRLSPKHLAFNVADIGLKTAILCLLIYLPWVFDMKYVRGRNIANNLIQKWDIWIVGARGYLLILYGAIACVTVKKNCWWNEATHSHNDVERDAFFHICQLNAFIPSNISTVFFLCTVVLFFACCICVGEQIVMGA